MIHTDQHVSKNNYVSRMTVIVVVYIDQPRISTSIEVEIGATWDKSNLLLSPLISSQWFLGPQFLKLAKLILGCHARNDEIMQSATYAVYSPYYQFEC